MISLLKNHINTGNDLNPDFDAPLQRADEANIINLIYRFAGKKDEWFNLLLSLSRCISIYRSLPDGHPYQGMSERLLSHLKNAIKISCRLNSGAYTLLNSQALDQLPIPAGVMDSRGRIVEINERAQHKIASLPQWSIRDQHLHLDHLDLSREINDLLASDEGFRALPVYSKNDLNNKSLNKIENHPHTEKDRLYLSQIPNSQDQSNPYIYFCFDQSRSRLVDPSLLRAHYQLTETEALVVTTLIEEVSSAKAAKKLKLKDATIRGHLSAIYQKMDVSRKPELIRKVMLLCLSQATINDSFFETGKRQETQWLLNTDHRHRQLKKLTLKDGRSMSYLDICYQGAHETQETVVLLHNLMGSAYELPPGAYQLLKQKNIRLLVPERPGYGGSDASPNRNHQDWCQDMAQLLNDLGISKVKVIAHSIGGTYALAMAEFIPERIERIAMVNAVTRIQDMLESKPVPVLITALHQSLRFAPFLIEPVLKMAVGKDIENFYTQQLNFMRPTKEGRAADINLLSQPEYRHYSINNLKQSARQGVQIWAEELKLSFAEWPFKVTNKTLEYQFWHGDEDDVISVQAAQRLAKDLNTQTFFQLKYETHFLFSRHINDILEQLIAPSGQVNQKHFQTFSWNKNTQGEPVASGE